MIRSTRRFLLLTGPALLAAGPARAAGPAVIKGIPAAPDGNARVAGTLTATPGQGAGAMVLDLVMTGPDGKAPIRRFDVELGKRLHVIGVDAGFRAFVHEHADAPGSDGHFRVPIRFPHAGPWQVYADAVPTGLGPQILRFPVPVAGPAAPAEPGLPPASLSGTDGSYGARFETLALRTGQEAQLALTLLRDGQPATDVTPYLGVAAHAVFINTADLSYVHVHATQAMADHGSKGGMGHAMAHGTAMPATAKVSPELTLMVRPPKSGDYRLWIQFMAGGAVRTVPFTVNVL